MNLSLSTDDLHEYGNLPPEVRADVDAWRRHFATVAKPITRALERVAREMNCDFVTARRKYSRWLKEGWRGLVNRAKCPTFSTAETAVSEVFVEWFKALAEKNQRKTKPAYRKFCEAWRRGAEIPGLDNDLPRHCLPPGCSYANLARKIKDAFSRDAMRRGLGFAIATHGPKVFTTRANLYVGSHVMIDDLWHDNFVVFKRQMVRVLELDAMDAFSGFKSAWGCKPRFQRDDGTFDNLKQKYALLTIASLFFNDGYSPRGTEIVAELGTAAVSDRVARILFDRTGGLIRLRENGITGAEQAIIGKRGQGKGNPRFKAALESLRNLIHNELGDVAGQTGLDVAHRPEFLHGELKECEDLLKAIAVLVKDKPERAALIKLPLLEYHSQFLPLLAEVYDRINSRTWHNLEGWHAAGNILIEYRTAPNSPNWLLPEDFNALPATSQQIILAAAQADPRYLQERKLSPREVYFRGRPALTKLPAFVISEILGDDYAQEREVKGAYFNEFSDMELAPEPMLFESVVETPNGERLQLRDDKYQTFVNPFDLSQMFVHDARGVHIGSAARVIRADRSDLEAVNRQFGNRAKRLAEVLTPIRKRHAQDVRERAAIMGHNADVISGITEAEHNANKREQRRMEDATKAEAAALAGVNVAEEILKQPTIAPVADENDWTA